MAGTGRGPGTADRRADRGDAQGGRSSFTFANFRKTWGLADKMFQFTIPRGTESSAVADLLKRGARGKPRPDHRGRRRGHRSLPRPAAPDPGGVSRRNAR